MSNDLETLVRRKFEGNGPQISEQPKSGHRGLTIGGVTAEEQRL